MGRFPKQGPARPPLLQNFICAGDRMYVIINRVHRNPLQLSRRRMTPDPVRLHDDLLGARKATIQRTPEENRITGR